MSSSEFPQSLLALCAFGVVRAWVVCVDGVWAAAFALVGVPAAFATADFVYGFPLVYSVSGHALNLAGVTVF